MLKIVGVLAVQGDFKEHIEALNELEGVEARPVKTREQIEACDALVIPGGESTTIGTLMERFELDKPVREMVEVGKPIWGTCAGMIVLAKDIVGSEQWRLGLMDITVERNAFGRQVDSFEVDLPVEGIDDPVRAVFIRAPYVREVCKACGVEVLAEFDGKIVLCRQGKLLASAFHPEMTDDRRVQQYFVGMIEE
ncbi:MAG TPA: pyridoxal 5'-phosphate synthase glutaminase subunit PdxT [Armatimonadetes bacterium]|nr:pyridoxal 5'-phosphate synthase glutaminase subunit PdxT [Armatimonadota bacterium]